MTDRCEELAKAIQWAIDNGDMQGEEIWTDMLRKFEREIRTEKAGNKILEMASEGRKEEIIDDERERILRELAAHTDKHDTHLFVRVPDVERIVKGEKDEASPHTNGS